MFLLRFSKNFRLQNRCISNSRVLLDIDYEDDYPRRNFDKKPWQNKNGFQNNKYQSNNYGNKYGNNYGNKSYGNNYGNKSYGNNYGNNYGNKFISRPKKPFVQNLISDYSSLKPDFPYTEAPELNFEDINLPSSFKRAIKQEFKYEKCSPVQAAVFSKLPIESDLLVQAKTGTGKTLSFLIPALMNAESKDGASVLIVSPTRELAFQIAKEAERLLRFTDLDVHCLVGGENKFRQHQQLQRRKVNVVVGTPGRLLDFIECDPKFKEQLGKVKTLVLDEADRMLEIGFKEDIKKISESLPSTKNTLLFSATYPKNVQELVRDTMKPDFQVVNTISKEDVSTLSLVNQVYHVASLSEQLEHLHRILTQGLSSSKPFKAMVFFPTNRMVQLFSDIFEQLNVRNILEIHALKDQKVRTNTSERFRRSNNAVLFTSDVSARGVDYPDVQIVIQIGVPGGKDQYVHRIGRTARAGKEGESLMFLCPFESGFVEDIKELPIKQVEVMEDGNLKLKTFEENVDLNKSREAVKNAASMQVIESAKRAYGSTLGYYNTHMDFFKRNNVPGYKVADELAGFLKFLGCMRTPPVPEGVAANFSRSYKF